MCALPAHLSVAQRATSTEARIYSDRLLLVRLSAEPLSFLRRLGLFSWCRRGSSFFLSWSCFFLLLCRRARRFFFRFGRSLIRFRRLFFAFSLWLFLLLLRHRSTI